MQIVFGGLELTERIPTEEGREMVQRYQDQAPPLSPFGYQVNRLDLEEMLKNELVKHIAVLFAKTKENRLTIVLKAVDINGNSIEGDDILYNRYGECCQPNPLQEGESEIMRENERKTACIERYFPSIEEV